MGCHDFWLTGEAEDFGLTEETRRQLPEKNLTMFPRTKVREIVGDQRVGKVVVVREGRDEELEVEGIFIFRDVPTTPLFIKAGLDLDHRQCVKTDRTQSTNILGVFAAGDLSCGGMQVVSAAGEGCVAALQAIKYLRMKEGG